MEMADWIFYIVKGTLLNYGTVYFKKLTLVIENENAYLLINVSKKGKKVTTERWKRTWEKKVQILK